MKKIRVFFIINCYSMGGGAESLLTTVVNNLDESKFEIGIMEIIHADKKVEPTKKHVKIYPYYTDAEAPDRKPRMYYVYHEWDKVIAEYIPQDYDVYISYNYLKPSFLLPPNGKNIAWIHSDVYDLLAPTMCEERELQNIAFEKAKKIVCVSKLTAKSVRELFPDHEDKVMVIFNGLDIERVKHASNESVDVKLNDKSVLCVGRLDDRKNPLRDLDVFKKVYDEDNEVHLYYLGFGDLSDAVREKSEEYGIADNVHFLGYHQNPFPVIKQCGAVLMMSKSEGFPMSLLEAVALDKPFVSTTVGGAETLSNGNKCGYVTDDNDEAAEKLLFMVNNRGYYTQKCRESMKRFNLDAYIGQIEKLILDVYNG